MASGNIESILSNNSFDFGYTGAKEKERAEYFSGANVKVYFGGVWMEHLAYIGFSLSEQVAPIYGFNSYTFDRVARGSRLVQGNFILNFTENGYLQTVLDRIALSMRSATTEEGALEPLTFSVGNDEEATVEALLANGGESFEQYIAALKNSFWGGSSDNRIAASSYQKENDVFFFGRENGEAGENPLKEHGFNILIDYSPSANTTDFEECIAGIKEAEGKGSVYQTYRSIIGVHITGVSEEIVNNNGVLQQSYQFIARDLDGDITKMSLATNFLFENQKIVFNKSDISDETLEIFDKNQATGNKNGTLEMT